jgi:DNA-binding PadR family transcriptional regulator
VSTLGFALLTLLARGPATGYSLRQQMRQPIGYFWTARHSQIYGELATLADAGLVLAREGQGPGPRAKKTYTITDAGRRSLAEWLPQPPVYQPRNELVLKAYGVNSADPGRMAEMYQTTADAARERAAIWRAELQSMAEQGYSDPGHPRFGNYAVLKMGVESQQLTHRWAAWLASELRKARDKELPDGGRER